MQSELQLDTQFIVELNPILLIFNNLCVELFIAIFTIKSFTLKIKNNNRTYVDIL